MTNPVYKLLFNNPQFDNPSLFLETACLDTCANIFFKMINIERFACNMLQENCYIVSDETKQCVIIDCGAYYEEERKAIARYVSDNGLKPVHLLVTHGHLDHNFGNAFVEKEYGLKPEVSHADQRLMEHMEEQAQTFNVTLNEALPSVGRYFEDGEQITFGSHKLTVIPTPGHTRGSVCFYCEQEHVMFTGDTLFKGSIGRTDFEGGSMLQIIQSLRMIAQMSDNIVVLSGHGEKTTLGFELAHNPYMDR